MEVDGKKTLDHGRSGSVTTRTSFFCENAPGNSIRNQHPHCAPSVGSSDRRIVGSSDRRIVGSSDRRIVGSSDRQLGRRSGALEVKPRVAVSRAGKMAGRSGEAVFRSREMEASRRKVAGASWEMISRPREAVSRSGETVFRPRKMAAPSRKTIFRVPGRALPARPAALLLWKHRFRPQPEVSTKGTQGHATGASPFRGLSCLSWTHPLSPSQPPKPNQP